MPKASERIVVIGGGANGLVAAFYLAKAGHPTLVLERRSIVGGSLVTEEIDPQSGIFPLFRTDFRADRAFGCGRLVWLSGLLRFLFSHCELLLRTQTGSAVCRAKSSLLSHC